MQYIYKGIHDALENVQGCKTFMNDLYWDSCRLEAGDDAEAIKYSEVLQRADDEMLLERVREATRGDWEVWREVMLCNRPRYVDHLYRVNEDGSQERVQPVKRVPHEPVPYEKALHLVVDIETLGTGIPSPILTIGAAILDCSEGMPGKIIKHDDWCVDLSECVGQMDTNTLLWWLNRSEAARKAAFGTPMQAGAFESFAEWVKELKPDYVWGNAPDFDMGHLEAQFSARGIEVPWKFWQKRDIRTLSGLFCAEPIPEDETTHVAKYDALREAKRLKAALILGV